MTAVRKLDAISVADYLAGEEISRQKHEYIDGTVHAMAGASNRHNRIASNGLGILINQLRGKPCEPFNSDTKVRIEFADHTRFYYPDVMVVCHPNPPGEHFQDHPVVIIEVLSESTRRIDLEEKSKAYLAIPSLKVLVLAESDRPLATVYRCALEGGFGIERHAGLDAIISLPEIAASLPLAELYERVIFEET